MGNGEPSLGRQVSVGRLDRAKRSRGLLIALCSVLIVTPDAMLVRWARELGGDSWQIVFWKQVGSGCINIVAGVILCGGLRATLRGIVAAPAHLLVATTIQALNQLGFNFAFLDTSAARAMLFISLNPLWAGVLGRCCLGDLLPTRTVIALAIGALSSLIVFIPSLLPSSPNEDSVSITGDIIAILTGLTLAMWITMMRYTLGTRPDAAIDLAAGLGNFLAGLFALPALLAPGGPGLLGNLDLSFAAVAATDALCTGACFVGLVVAPRYLLGAELALLLLLETLLAPFWVFIKFGDIPSPWTAAGGAMLIGALAVHEVADIRAKRMAKRAPPLGDALSSEVSAPRPTGSLSNPRPTGSISNPMPNGSMSSSRPNGSFSASRAIRIDVADDGLSYQRFDVPIAPPPRKG